MLSASPTPPRPHVLPFLRILTQVSRLLLRGRDTYCHTFSATYMPRPGSAQAHKFVAGVSCYALRANAPCSNVHCRIHDHESDEVNK